MDNYVYPAVLGQMLEADYGYSGISVANFGGFVYTAQPTRSQQSSVSDARSRRRSRPATW